MIKKKWNKKSAVRMGGSEFGVGEGWRIYITHADDIGLAEKAKQMLAQVFPKAVFETQHLTPAFVTQGGPGCVAVQVIKSM